MKKEDMIVGELYWVIYTDDPMKARCLANHEGRVVVRFCLTSWPMNWFKYCPSEHEVVAPVKQKKGD